MARSTTVPPVQQVTEADTKGPSETPLRLGGAEAAVLIVLVLTSAALAYTGMPLLAILQLLLGVGVVGAATITMFHVRPTRRLFKVLRALLGSHQ
ncbi:hypothetical protein ACFVY1_25915 [Streptomyces sp. NPDC058293]|uniref:hypothetical protein n=1 Tax=Streptomyces sp. NPDC058293 TaxID=3346429 RepID=UPI0036E054FB